MDIKLEGRHKAAIVVSSLKKPLLMKVIQKFSPEEILNLWNAMRELEQFNIQRDGVGEILGEYLKKSKETVFGLPSQFVSLLREVLGESEAEMLLPQLQGSKGQTFSSLREIDSNTLSSVLQVEHPQTVALVLSHLDREKTSEILSTFSVEEQLDIIKRLLSLRETSQDIREEIARKIWTRASGWSRGSSLNKQDDEQKAKDVAEILYLLGGGKELLDGLAEDDPQTAEKIRDLMVVFKDLQFVSVKDIQKILAQVDSKTIATAIKGVEDEVRDHILAALSKRVREIVLDEKEMLGAVPSDEVFEAQRAVMKVAKTMQEEGSIRINKGGGTQVQMLE